MGISTKNPAVPQKLKKLLNANDLVYVTDTELSIERHKKGTGFYYTKNGRKISADKKLARFKSLVIPPAWKDVKICHLKNGHLQAVGRDTKNRKVYRYHPDWIKLKKRNKFSNLYTFGKNLLKIRKQIAKDLARPELSKEKVLALVVRLMEETHIRIGNEQYTSENGSFGLSTMHDRHVNTLKMGLKFEFVGKKGKQHEVTLKNKKLVKLVRQCKEIPGYELFQYYDENKDKHTIDSRMVNEYLHKITGNEFSAKDFRTWTGTKLFFEALLELGYTEEEKDKKHNLTLAYKETAKALGNTKTVCEHYYVHPEIPRQYNTGEIEQQFKKVQQTKPGTYLSNTEKVVLGMIEKSDP